MEELQLSGGDLVPNGAGGFSRLEGSSALVQRILFKLTARRGMFPFLPRLGSKLYTLPREKESNRQALAAQYVVQALEDEDVTVTDVVYSRQGEQTWVNVYLDWQGEPLEVTAQIGGTDENS